MFSISPILFTAYLIFREDYRSWHSAVHPNGNPCFVRVLTPEEHSIIGTYVNPATSEGQVEINTPEGAYRLDIQQSPTGLSSLSVQFFPA